MRFVLSSTKILGPIFEFKERQSSIWAGEESFRVKHIVFFQYVFFSKKGYKMSYDRRQLTLEPQMRQLKLQNLLFCLILLFCSLLQPKTSSRSVDAQIGGNVNSTCQPVCVGLDEVEVRILVQLYTGSYSVHGHLLQNRGPSQSALFHMKQLRLPSFIYHNLPFQSHFTT